MMMRLLIVAITAALLGSGSASAQIGGLATSPGPSPLGMTSPLGIGPAAPVAPTGIPLGATELATPGVSPMTSGASPVVPAIGGATACSGAGAVGGSTGLANPGTSGSTTIFDGGGLGGTASGTCAATASGSSGGPAASASSPTGMGAASAVGRVGIPLGSTELNVGGLSPPPDVLTPNPSAPLSTSGTPCPTTGMSGTVGPSSNSC
jgi:hypothetical protein